MSDDDDPERTRQFYEMGELCATWRLRGIHPAVMAARLMQCALVISEAVGVPCENVIKHVHAFFNPAPPARPSAKA